MLEFWDFVYISINVMVILVLKEIIEYVFITRKGGNVIKIEETQSNTKTNEIGTNTRFKKKKGTDDKVVEGFLDCQISPTHPIDDLTSSIGSATTPISNCERATWLFCDTNFDKLRRIINGTSVDDTDENNKFTFTTNGGDMITDGGVFQYIAGQRPSETDVSG